MERPCGSVAAARFWATLAGRGSSRIANEGITNVVRGAQTLGPRAAPVPTSTALERTRPTLARRRDAADTRGWHLPRRSRPGIRCSPSSTGARQPSSCARALRPYAAPHTTRCGSTSWGGGGGGGGGSVYGGALERYPRMGASSHISVERRRSSRTRLASLRRARAAAARRPRPRRLWRVPAAASLRHGPSNNAPALGNVEIPLPRAPLRSVPALLGRGARRCGWGRGSFRRLFCGWRGVGGSRTGVAPARRPLLSRARPRS